jgi:muramidase (phage lysozyme)
MHNKHVIKSESTKAGKYTMMPKGWKEAADVSKQFRDFGKRSEGSG